MNPTWKAAIGVILIFILGWFGGALTTIIVAHQKLAPFVQRDPERMATVLERQSMRGLALNENQRSQIHALLVENIRTRLQLQHQIQPEVRAANHETLQKIDALITPAQQQKLRDNLLAIKARAGGNPLSIGAEERANGTPTPAPDSSTNNSPAE